jgi:hypothetical protein
VVLQPPGRGDQDGLRAGAARPDLPPLLVRVGPAHHDRDLEARVVAADRLGLAWHGVRSRCRFRNRGTEYVSESGMKWMGGGTKRQCDRALASPAICAVSSRVGESTSTWERQVLSARGFKRVGTHSEYAI